MEVATVSVPSLKHRVTHCSGFTVPIKQTIYHLCIAITHLSLL